MYFHFQSFLKIEMVQLVETADVLAMQGNRASIAMVFTHLPLDKMATISQTIFSNSFLFNENV